MMWCSSIRGVFVPYTLASSPYKPAKPVTTLNLEALLYDMRYPLNLIRSSNKTSDKLCNCKFMDIRLISQLESNMLPSLVGNEEVLSRAFSTYLTWFIVAVVYSVVIRIFCSPIRWYTTSSIRICMVFVIKLKIFWGHLCQVNRTSFLSSRLKESVLTCSGRYGDKW